jgi:hypothetical protein
MVEQKQFELENSLSESSQFNLNHIKKTPESFNNLTVDTDSTYFYADYEETLNKFEGAAALFSSDPESMQSHLMGREYSDYLNEYGWMICNTARPKALNSFDPSCSAKLAKCFNQSG